MAEVTAGLALGELVAVPFVGALLAAAAPRRWRAPVALVAAILAAVGVLVLLGQLDPSVGAAQLADQPLARVGLDGLGVSWHLALDSTSALLLAVVTLLVPIAIFAGSDDRDGTASPSTLLVMEGLACLSLASTDLLSFCLGAELLFAVGRRASSRTALPMGLSVGATLALVAVAASLHGRGDGGFSLEAIASDPLPLAEQRWVLLGWSSALLGRMGLAPFHALQRDCWRGVGAPLACATSVIASSCVGVAGLLRVSVGLCPAALGELSAPLMMLASLSSVVGATIAWRAKGVGGLASGATTCWAGLVLLGLTAGGQEGVEGVLLATVACALTALACGIAATAGAAAELIPGPHAPTARWTLAAGIAAGATPLSLLWVGQIVVLGGAMASALPLDGSLWSVFGVTGTATCAGAATALALATARGRWQPPRAAARALPRLALSSLLIGVLVVGLGVYPRAVVGRVHAAVERIHATACGPQSAARAPQRRTRCPEAAAPRGQGSP